ncbi:LOW QUALITY PROTEIN: larval cuticle protein 1 [Drosophila tropicalis]|uniref:LOW QUALITY PROTEIN: larval cuticle protein 1 n=1 Tax=Drosophila tropicalis TaxID=46794 RepID=UPI0035ABC9A0
MAHPWLIILGVLLFIYGLPITTAAPAAVKEKTHDTKAQLLDRFNHRYPDGSYEYRFELDDGTARYERGYFALVNEVKTLMVVGYYSYRMTDGRYITVFYNADQFGYRQNQSITPQVYPNLPRSIDVPLGMSQRSSSSSSSSSRSRSSTSPHQDQAQVAFPHRIQSKSMGKG